MVSPKTITQLSFSARSLSCLQICACFGFLKASRSPFYPLMWMKAKTKWVKWLLQGGIDSKEVEIGIWVFKRPRCSWPWGKLERDSAIPLVARIDSTVLEVQVWLAPCLITHTRPLVTGGDALVSHEHAKQEETLRKFKTFTGCAGYAVHLSRMQFCSWLTD